MTVIRRLSGRQSRRGATTVEAAVVISIFLLLMLGLFEYGRFLMLQHLLVNAAREGCRYAVAHNAEADALSATQALVKYCMFGFDAQFPDFTVQAYPTNSPGAPLGAANPDDPITVRASGTFTTMFPTLLLVPSTIPLSSSSIMTCEGN